MKRIRLVFLLLSLVILVALALLVRRALESAAAERAVQHRAVAERIFDEMERELTDFLHGEEERPFAHWAELEPQAERPFVVGYFQIAPDGAVSNPRVVDAVRAVWEARPAPPPAFSQKAGTTIALDAEANLVSKLPQEQYLDSLNRAAQTRNERLAKKTVKIPVPDLSAAVPEAQDATLEPMVGRLATPGRLVLYRTAWVGERAWRQGLVVASAELFDAVSGRVLADGALAAKARFHLEGAAAAPPADVPAATYVYRHRFAEPFGAVTGELELQPLPYLGGDTYLLSLSLLVGLAATAGLFALYRMVAVVVDYAERRHNFVSAVTHELKTPLTSIRMYGEMLRDGVVPGPEARHDYYEIITAEAERLSRLLDNVLELARLEKKSRAVHLVTGDVRPVLDEVLGILGPHAARQGFALRLAAEPGLPAVRYDRDALVQVLLNLVDNALKYAREPAVAEGAAGEVVLACRRHGDGVRLSVADRGPGVAERHLDRIFEPFYRGEDELTRTSKGTGLGLALVRGLVERMGGRVAGANREGGGFEVSVCLESV